MRELRDIALALVLLGCEDVDEPDGGTGPEAGSSVSGPSYSFTVTKVSDVPLDDGDVINAVTIGTGHMCESSEPGDFSCPVKISAEAMTVWQPDDPSAGVIDTPEQAVNAAMATTESVVFVESVSNCAGAPREPGCHIPLLEIIFIEASTFRRVPEILLHELGHALNMGHVEGNCAAIQFMCGHIVDNVEQFPGPQQYLVSATQCGQFQTGSFEVRDLTLGSDFSCP